MSWSVTSFIILFEADYYYSLLATLNIIFYTYEKIYSIQSNSFGSSHVHYFI